MRDIHENPQHHHHQQRSGCITRLLCNRTGLLALVTVYAVVGAAIFHILEGNEYGSGGGGGDGALLLPTQVQKSREDCLRELWLITERLNVLYEKNWTKLVTEQLKQFERVVVESGRLDGKVSAATATATATAAATGDPSSRWTFGGALLYCLTLLTTIGYGRLSPRTAAGKVAAIFYALVGVPLMIILLSALGSLLAETVTKLYCKVVAGCCSGGHQRRRQRQRLKEENNRLLAASVGYQKQTCSSNHNDLQNCKAVIDECSIQTTYPNQPINIHYNACHNNRHSPDYSVDHHHHHHGGGEQKKTILATVRATHARGRCRNMQVRQMLADPELCAMHSSSQQGTSPLRRNNMGFVAGGGGAASDIEESDETDDNSHGILCAHDTPSRVPLICQESAALMDKQQGRQSPPLSQMPPPQPSVPVSLVILLFTGYVCLGAAALVSTAATSSDWTFLDAAYFCFIALSTIGLGGGDGPNLHVAQLAQQLACCVYLFVGLVLVAMCFSLVHEEFAAKCRRMAVNVRLLSDTTN